MRTHSFDTSRPNDVLGGGHDRAVEVMASSKEDAADIVPALLSSPALSRRVVPPLVVIACSKPRGLLDPSVTSVVASMICLD